MPLIAGITTVVRNTFLEIQEDEQPKTIARSQTASDMIGCSNCESPLDSDAETDVPSHEGWDTLPPTPTSARVGGSTAALPPAESWVLPTLHVNLVVKNTFLELEEAEDAQPAIRRSQTDSAALQSRWHFPAAPQQSTESSVTAEGTLTHETPTGSGSVEACADAAADAVGETRTTIMLRNLPNDYTRSMLLEWLDTNGFACCYDFVYLPVDFKRCAGLGYAFVNMLSPADALRSREVLTGFRRWTVPSVKVCSVGWSNPCQGFEANIERYRNSPVMHSSVSDEFKPVTFKDGVRIPFPKASKKIKKPDQRKGSW